jgi:hypothetical protein
MLSAKSKHTTYLLWPDNTPVSRCDLLFSAHQRSLAFDCRHPANRKLSSGLGSVFQAQLINMEANYLPRGLPWVGSWSAAETLRCDIVRFSRDGSCKREFMSPSVHLSNSGDDRLRDKVSENLFSCLSVGVALYQDTLA